VRAPNARHATSLTSRRQRASMTTPTAYRIEKERKYRKNGEKYDEMVWRRADLSQLSDARRVKPYCFCCGVRRHGGQRVQGGEGIPKPRHPGGGRIDETAKRRRSNRLKPDRKHSEGLFGRGHLPPVDDVAGRGARARQRGDASGKARRHDERMSAKDACGAVVLQQYTSHVNVDQSVSSVRFMSSRCARS